MAKIGNILNQKLFLKNMNTLAQLMRGYVKESGIRLNDLEQVTLTVQLGRDARNDTTPVDVDPDGDYTLTDVALGKLETKVAQLRLLFNSLDDQNPAPEPE